MIKTLADLTPEILAKIPAYQKKVLDPIFDGSKYSDFNYDDAVAAVEWNYKFCQYKKPIVIVAENPYEAQVFFHILTTNELFKDLGLYLYEQKNKEDNESETYLNNNTELHKKLHESILNALNEEITKSLNESAESKLHIELFKKFYDVIYRSLIIKTRGELKKENHLDTSKVNDLHNELFNKIRSSVDSDLEGLLRNDSFKKLFDILGNFIKNTTQDNLRKSLETISFKEDYLFTLNIYSQVIYTWYSFIKNEFNLSLSVEKEFEECFTLHDKSCIYSAILSEVYCVVSKYPKEINMNAQNELHNTTKDAVIWDKSTELTDWNCYYVNGRNIEKEWFNKAINVGTPQGITFDEFQKLDNEDIKASIIAIIKENKGNKGLLEFLDAVLIDEQVVNHGQQPIYNFGKNYDEDNSEKHSDLKIIGYKEHKETLKLYKTNHNFDWANDSKGNNNVKLAWIEMICPSTGQPYLIECCPTFTDVVKAVKWLRPSKVPATVPYLWQSAN